MLSDGTAPAEPLAEVLSLRPTEPKPSPAVVSASDRAVAGEVIDGKPEERICATSRLRSRCASGPTWPPTRVLRSRNQITGSDGQRDDRASQPACSLWIARRLRRAWVDRRSSACCLCRNDVQACVMPCHAGRRGGFCARAVSASGVSLGDGALLGADIAPPLRMVN